MYHNQTFNHLLVRLFDVDKLLSVDVYLRAIDYIYWQNLLEQDVFHRSLFSICLEIVIFSYNSQRYFFKV